MILGILSEHGALKAPILPNNEGAARHLRSSEERNTMPGFMRAGMFAPTSRRFRHML